MNSTKKNIKNIEKFVKIIESGGMNLELLFATEVLELNSLHYGYWEGNEDLTLANFGKAQERYTETLVDLVPKGVKTILDVGCGIGDNAQALAKKGYAVTAISPDKNHQKFFTAHKHEKIKFETTNLENYTSNKKFDLFLLSESQTYFDPQITFEQCTNHLNKPGCLLISDIFNNKRKHLLHGVTHTAEDYILEAAEYGLELVNSIDITKQILPSIQLAYNIYYGYLLPSLKIIDHYLKHSAPLKRLIILTLFRKQLKEVGKVIEFYKARLDPTFFKEELNYKRLLFKHK